MVGVDTQVGRSRRTVEPCSLTRSRIELRPPPTSVA